LLRQGFDEAYSKPKTFEPSKTLKCAGEIPRGQPNTGRQQPFHQSWATGHGSTLASDGDFWREQRRNQAWLRSPSVRILHNSRCWWL